MKKSNYLYLLLFLSILQVNSALAQEVPQQVSGVFPSLSMTAGHFPRTEAGTGALMPWANRLWIVTYVAHLSGTGSGTGLYEIDENMNLTQHPKSIVGTYANRIIHTPSMRYWEVTRRHL